MSDLGLLSYYLGIEVHQKLGEITLCQEAYAKKILEKCGMEGIDPCVSAWCCTHYVQQQQEESRSFFVSFFVRPHVDYSSCQVLLSLFEE